MANESLATLTKGDIASSLETTGVTLDGVLAFLEDQVQSEDKQASRLAFTLAETAKFCIRDLEESADVLRKLPQ